jgi:hypothetical protein
MHRFDLDQFKRTERKITFRYQLVGLPCATSRALRRVRRSARPASQLLQGVGR